MSSGAEKVTELTVRGWSVALVTLMATTDATCFMATSGTAVAATFFATP